MALPSDLVKEFAQITINDKNAKKETTVYGTVKKYGNALYVQLDGSDMLTPVETTSSIKDGDRVMVLIKNHSATVTGNISKPSANKDDVKQEVADKITEFEIVITDKIVAVEGEIDNLQADNVIIKDKLTANEGEFNKLKADYGEFKDLTTGNFEATNGKIENLETKKLDAEVADITFAKIGDLEATNADIHNLRADYGEFKNLTTDKFEATDATIKNLDADKLSVKDAEIKFANIDFANIGKAAIENFFSKSGMIGDLVVGDGTITGTLVGVTIKGDLIEGGTVVADKLVIKGTDGLYYKLNTDGEKVGAQQTEYNSLNGSIITAKSVTAEKISVKDLVAFGATIGGFHITDNSLYSGVKESAINTTRGVFLGDDGQFAVGDASNYLKFFKDTDDKFKLAISASAIKLGTTGTSVEESLKDVIDRIVTEYYLSTSSTALSDGAWSTTSPTWTEGRYVWTRNMTVKKSGAVSYSEPVCVTGNTGADGKDGTDGTIASETEPLDKTKVWLDTSVTPSILKRWNGSKWEIVNEVQIGGRNLLRGTAIEQSAHSNRTEATNQELTYGYFNWEMPPSLIKMGDEVTVSFEIKTSNGTDKVGIWMREERPSYAAGVITSIYPTTEWVKHSYTFTRKSEKDWWGLLFGNAQYTYPNNTGIMYVRNAKLERGNKATDWTPAPEDIDQNITDVENSLGDRIDETNNNVDKVTANMEILEDRIVNLVASYDLEYYKVNYDSIAGTYTKTTEKIDTIDGVIVEGAKTTTGENVYEGVLNGLSVYYCIIKTNFETLMEQTGDGWSFNMKTISGNIDAVKDGLGAVEKKQGKTEALVDGINETVDSINTKTAYIDVTTIDGKPAMVLGSLNSQGSGSDFKVVITNESIDFMNGSTKIAYASGNKFFAPMMVTTNSIQIGESPGFRWEKRSNGNLGLIYIE